jgi:hypothetical protein
MMKRRPLLASVITSLTAILILAAGCGDQSPTATRLEPTTLNASRGGVGHHARTIKRHHRAGHVSETIGRRGGTIDFGIGTLVVPPGALRHNTRISATVNGEDLAVEFEPHGLKFRRGREATLTFDYARSDGEADDLQVFYVDNSETILESLPTLRSSNRQTFSTKLEHFSGYLLGSW